MKQKRLLFLLVLLLTATTGAWAQTGMINGLFSVSATKRVYFSKGNLQYDGTNWKFAASQWEVLGANGTGASGTATNYPMDLFTWGNIDSPTYNGTTYYTKNADLSGITDWGSRMGSGWYTLSKDEWLYLFGMESNNTDKSGHARYRKYFRAKVNGVSGIVVLPDDLSGISDIPAESSRGTASTFNGKTYTTDAWSAMESAGCVFLPAAGFRKEDGTTVSHIGLDTGFYWTSTAYDAGKAYTMGINSGNVDPANNFNRIFGFSVRLVIDQYYLTLADGVKDADKWTVKVGEGQAQALPIGGLKGDGSETVTLQYNGRLKVKGVKVTSDEKPAAPSVTEVTTFSELQTALSAGKDVKLMNDIVCTEEINITKGALTIDGNGRLLIAGSAIRAFKVGSSATVAFKNLALREFVSGGGPAINNSGTIVLDGCTIGNCHVNNSNGGGAIENKGKLYAINTTFSNNYSGEIGGAINNYTGSLYMSGCTFINNYTTKSDAYYGGAIGINMGSEVRLINCEFFMNKYGTNTGYNDIGVYNNPTNYTIAGCTGATIASNNGDITTNATGTATLDYSDLSNISFTYNAE